MRVLVACEFSGIVREAFAKRGHDAWSCDLLDTEIPGQHIQADVLGVLDGLPLCPICKQVFEVQHNCYICHNCGHLVPLSPDFVVKQPWDLMIGHPPCTYFANAGLHYLRTQPNRQTKLDEAFAFIKELWGAPIEKICIENPVGWLNTHWMKPAQIVQPAFFGTMELKTTCLWLKKLPPLMATYYGKVLPDGYCIRRSGKQVGKRYNYYWRQGKSGRNRSITFSAIADAMAEQWG